MIIEKLSENQIEEGNKLIHTLLFPKDKNIKMFIPKGFQVLEINYLDWSRLMALVEKIENELNTELYTKFYISISDKRCVVHCCSTGCQDGIIYQTPLGVSYKTKIEAVFVAIIEFIKWYNIQTHNADTKTD